MRSSSVCKRVACMSTTPSFFFKSSRLFASSTTRDQNLDAISTLVKDHRKVSHLIEEILAMERGTSTRTSQYTGSSTSDLTKNPSPTSPTGSVTAASDPWSHPTGDAFSTGNEYGKSNAVEKRRMLEEMIKELSIHSHIEEMHLYPIIRDTLKNGNQLIDRSLNEHQVLKETLYDLDQFSGSLGTNPEAWPAFPVQKLESLRSNLQKHVQEEEEEIFPEFKKVMSQEKLNALGETLDRARSHVPTRPHPSAPNQPPMMNVAGAAAQVFDKAKDAMRSMKDSMTTGP